MPLLSRILSDQDPRPKIITAFGRTPRPYRGIMEPIHISVRPIRGGRRGDGVRSHLAMQRIRSLIMRNGHPDAWPWGYLGDAHKSEVPICEPVTGLHPPPAIDLAEACVFPHFGLLRRLWRQGMETKLFAAVNPSDLSPTGERWDKSKVARLITYCSKPDVAVIPLFKTTNRDVLRTQKPYDLVCRKTVIYARFAICIRLEYTDLDILEAMGTATGNRQRFNAITRKDDAIYLEVGAIIPKSLSGETVAAGENGTTNAYRMLLKFAGYQLAPVFVPVHWWSNTGGFWAQHLKAMRSPASIYAKKPKPTISHPSSRKAKVK